MERTPEEEKRRRRSPATPEQMAARRQDAEARSATASRKKRTRELIQLGGVCAHYGFKTPDQVDALLSALAKRDAWVEWLGKRDVDLKRETT